MGNSSLGFKMQLCYFLNQQLGSWVHRTKVECFVPGSPLQQSVAPVCNPSVQSGSISMAEAKKSVLL